MLGTSLSRHLDRTIFECQRSGETLDVIQGMKAAVAQAGVWLAPWRRSYPTVVRLPHWAAQGPRAPRMSLSHLSPPSKHWRDRNSSMPASGQHDGPQRTQAAGAFHLAVVQTSGVEELLNSSTQDVTQPGGMPPITSSPSEACCEFDSAERNPMDASHSGPAPTAFHMIVLR